MVKEWGAAKGVSGGASSVAWAQPGAAPQKPRARAYGPNDEGVPHHRIDLVAGGDIHRGIALGGIIEGNGDDALLRGDVGMRGRDHPRAEDGAAHADQRGRHIDLKAAFAGGRGLDVGMHLAGAHLHPHRRGLPQRPRAAPG